MLPLPELPQVHDRFLDLSRAAHEHFGESFGGRFLLRCGFDPDGIAAVVAASVAGAASLCVDADADRLRDGLRAGLIDFVVATLDEALRILKNEIRRARPVSVGLTADPEASIAEMIARGLQPDLLSAIPQPQAGAFLERGAVPMTSQPTPSESLALLAWTVTENPAQSMPRVAEISAAALDLGHSDTPARQRWLRQSPRALGRAFGPHQCLRMTIAESAAFAAQARGEIPAVTITRDGEPL